MNQQQTQTAKVNVHGLGQYYNLGSFRKEYKTMSWVWWCLLLVCIICSITILPFLLLAVGMIIPLTHIPPEIVFSIFGAIIVGLILLNIFGFHKIVTGVRLHGYIYDDGFICCTSKGIVQQVVRWTDVIVVCHSVEKSESTSRDSSESSSSSTSTSYTDRYSFTLRNEIEPVSLPFGTEFDKAVEWEVANAHIHSAQSAYRFPGGIAKFGRLNMGSQGLYDTVKRTMILWSEVESIRLDYYGTVHIKKRGGQRDWSYFPIGELNNPELLRRLIETEVPYRFEVSLFNR